MLYTPRLGALGDLTVFMSIYLVTIAFFKGVVEPTQVHRLRSTLVVLFIVLLTYCSFLYVSNPPFDIAYNSFQ